MVGILTRDNRLAFGSPESFPVEPGETDVSVVRLRTGVCVEYAVEIIGADRCDLSRQFRGHRRRGPEECVVVR